MSVCVCMCSRCVYECMDVCIHPQRPCVFVGACVRTCVDVHV